MKKTSIIIILILSASNCFSQIFPITISSDFKYSLTDCGSGFFYKMNQVDMTDYESAYIFMIRNKYGEASRKFYDFYKDYPDEREISMNSLFYAGECAFRNNEFDRSERILKELIKTPDASNYDKHMSCEFIASINFTKKNYAESIKYMDIASKKYPQYATCSNGEAANQVRGAVTYAVCYEGLGKIDEAIKVLQNFAFWYDFDRNSGACDLYVRLLEYKYDKVTLQKSLSDGIKNLDEENGTFYLDFLGIKYDLASLNGEVWKAIYEYMNIRKNKDAVISLIKNDLTKTILYKLIME